MEPEYSAEQVNSLIEFLGLNDLPEWQDRARCLGVSQDIFYGPEEGQGTKRHRPTLTPTDIARAKSYCQECEVNVECLEFALRMDEHHGIWGGLTPRERENLNKQSRKDR
jgi:WhiB family redox-sensing transcriptional regulator